MYRFFFSLCILSFLSIAQAKESRTLDINPLNFSNRADCARDSQKPTRSVFFIADTLDVGKSLLRAGDLLSRQDTFTAEGIKRYRFTLQSLSKLVAEKLLKGQLPLLNAKLPEYSDLVDSCKEGCYEMDQLVAEAWAGRLQGERLNFSGSHMSCHEVKDFAALYPHLLDSKPTKDSLKALGQSMTAGSEHLVECNIDNPGDLSVSFYQFDLRHIDQKLWDKVGFDFWSSFNIYFSWAFRHSPEARQMALNYHGLFRQVNLEELSFFFSNGCNSLGRPECSKDFLNTNSLRELSRVSQDADLAKLQVFMPSPDHPGQAHSAMSSISTQAPIGIWATPKALRAWAPTWGPKTWPSNSLQPFVTRCCSVKSPVELTKLMTFTMRLTLFRSPTAACSVPIRSMATARAAC